MWGEGIIREGGGGWGVKILIYEKCACCDIGCELLLVMNEFNLILTNFEARYLKFQDL